MALLDRDGVYGSPASISRQKGGIKAHIGRSDVCCISLRGEFRLPLLVASRAAIKISAPDYEMKLRVDAKTKKAPAPRNWIFREYASG